MRCSFCTRQAEHEFREHSLCFCETCGKAYREGFEHGKVYESVRRRQSGRGRNGKVVG